MREAKYPTSATSTVLQIGRAWRSVIISCSFTSVSVLSLDSCSKCSTGNKALIFLLHILSIMACLSVLLMAWETQQKSNYLPVPTPCLKYRQEERHLIDTFNRYNLEDTSGALKAIFTMQLTHYSIKAIFTWRQESSFPGFHCWFSYDKILLDSASTPPQQKEAADKFGGELTGLYRLLTPQLSWAASVSSQQQRPFPASEFTWGPGRGVFSCVHSQPQ